ncbi:MAG: hypothetical protein IIT39_01670 [Clostridia bacterium]|nr:hypothetical protein [Clostridia bacterium]
MGIDVLHTAMKAAAKKRKIKLSAEDDLYKRIDPYFYDTFYSCDYDECKKSGIAAVNLTIEVKYCRFDELRWHIISPDSDLKFTDKIRANSLAKCKANFPCVTVEFMCDETEQGVDQLCEDILNWLQKYYNDFFDLVQKQYGRLEDYYIANKESFPLLAGLVYIEEEMYAEAEKCFLLPNMIGHNDFTCVEPQNEEQRKRVAASCKDFRYRSDYEKLLDYTIAMQNNLEWTSERAEFGLLPDERIIK